MDSPFLTIGEAVEKTGRSPSTIRRVIRTIADSPAHPDRKLIEPSPKEVDVFKKKGENFTWKICEDVLLKNLRRVQREEKTKSSVPSSGPSGEVLQILQRELDLKNQQIEKQWKVIDSLSERLREGNILMGSLQKRLALPEPAAAETVVHAVELKTSAEPSKASKKPSKESAVDTKPAKKGLFGWFRG